MKTISIAKLKHALSTVGAFSATASPIEGFLCVKIEERDDRLQLTCSCDMGSASATIKTESDGSANDQSCYVPMKRFRDVVASSPGVALDVHVEHDGVKFIMARGSVSIRASNVTVPDMSEAASGTPCELDPKAMAQEIDAMLSIHDTPSHVGIRIIGGKRSSTVRVATAAAAWCEPTCWAGEGEAMLPAEHGKATSAFLSNCGDGLATCRIGDRGISIRGSDAECFVRTVEVSSVLKIPQVVFDAKYSPLGSVSRSELIGAINSCRTVCVEESRQVKLAFGGDNMTIVKRAGVAGSAQMQISVDGGVNDDGCMFDATLLHKVLSGLSGKTVTLGRIDHDDLVGMAAMRLESGGVTVIQMCVVVE